jgi:anti-sigma factor RsiW
MSCHDARERLSDLLDDALATEARAQVDSHLAGCADCRSELDRLRATVSLLRAVERPQAPAGFVDRVLEAARPAPWYRRLIDWLAVVRLLRFPVEAAAVVLVASLAVYVFQETPALRQAARPEDFQDQVADSSVSTKSRTAASDVGPDSAGREPTERAVQGFTKSLRLPPPVPSTSSPTPPMAAPEATHEQHPMQAPAPQELVAGFHNSPRVESDSALSELARSAPDAPGMPQRAAPAPGAAFTLADPSNPTEGRLQPRRKDSVAGGTGATERPATQSPPAGQGPARAPELRERMTREEQGQAERSAPAWIPAVRPPGPSAMRSAASIHVVGWLTVKDRPAANRELRELLSRVGGAETARRGEGGGDTVHLVVPRAAYPTFAQGLARIGVWVPETEPPELPDRVPITLRITQ